MDDLNARHVSNFGAVLSGPNLGSVAIELPKPTEWDQLLVKLGLNDSQALEAVKSGQEKGDQVRNFVLKFFRQYFVPEPVIAAVSRFQKDSQVAISLATQPTPVHSNAI
jgi:hypothetical protein